MADATTAHQAVVSAQVAIDRAADAMQQAMAALDTAQDRLNRVKAQIDKMNKEEPNDG